MTDTCLLPANAGGIETQVRSLGQEDPLEEGTATHFSLLAWGIQSWTEEPGRLQSLGSQSQSLLKCLSMITRQIHGMT